MIQSEHGVFLSFYGDDFTGSTDVMESLTMNGIPAVLFLAPPSKEEVENFRLKNRWYKPDGKVEAFGVAGVSRSMTPEQMERKFPPIFKAIRKIPSVFFHYKVCSTFDSSSKIGNIGHAVEIILEHFPAEYIPLLVGAPPLNRFCIFGNLFAKVDGVTYRLDRHPTMSKHPVTPMTESDIREHLSKQTNRPVKLFDLFALEDSWENQENHFSRLIKGKGEYLLLDTYNDDHLRNVGRLIYEKRGPAPQLLVSSSGIEYALTSYLQHKGVISHPSPPDSPGRAEQMIIMAGSCSPTTGKQIQWIEKAGFKPIRIDTSRLIDTKNKNSEIDRVISQTDILLRQGENVVVFTAKGPSDPAIQKTKNKMRELSLPEGATSDGISKAQGKILLEILKTLEKLPRVVVAGGDTSGYVSLELGIHALEVLVPIAPGAPLCLAHSNDPQFDGMEISLKGGQNGKERYFESVFEGKALE